MAYESIRCENPFDRRDTNVAARIDEGVGGWCDLEFLRNTIKRSVVAAGRAWWDAYAVHRQLSGEILPAWVWSEPAETTFLTVPVGFDLLRVDGGMKYFASKGYPSSLSDVPGIGELVRIRTQIDSGFFSPGTTGIKRIYEAFREVYLNTLLKRELHLRCTSRCSGNHVATWSSDGKIRLCQPFFTGGESAGAATLIEELLHGYAGVAHSVSPAVEEADYYQAYLLRYYLT